MLARSIVLTALLSEAETNVQSFSAMAEKLCDMGVSVIEYCSCSAQLAEKRRILASLGMQSVYLGAITQKRSHSSLCETNDARRRQAVAEAMCLIDEAEQAGADTVLFTSGWYPAEPALEAQAWDALECSCRALLAHAAGGPAVTLEQGDRTVEFCQLMGYSPAALAFLSRFAQDEPRLWITMDTSHSAQLGEDAATAIQSMRGYCRHIHLANCVLNKADAMYGDKHPLFDVKNGRFSSLEAAEMLSFADSFFTDIPGVVGLEIINRASARSCEQALAILAQNAWFFTGNQ